MLEELTYHYYIFGPGTISFCKMVYNLLKYVYYPFFCSVTRLFKVARGLLITECTDLFLVPIFTSQQQLALSTFSGTIMGFGKKSKNWF